MMTINFFVYIIYYFIEEMQGNSFRISTLGFNVLRSLRKVLLRFI
jgi:hypothetical protein